MRCLLCDLSTTTAKKKGPGNRRSPKKSLFLQDLLLYADLHQGIRIIERDLF